MQGRPQPPGALKGGLLGVSFAGRFDGWAVGVACVPDCNRGREDTLILHWNGSRWSRQASQDPSPIEGLFSVSAVSAADAWTAGGYFTDSGAFRTLILHWNGSAWSPVASPDPSRDHQAGMNVISQVAAISASNAWAVGWYCARRCQQGGEVDRTMILHWNGTKWTAVRSPDPGPGHSVLAGVTAITAADAWAVGSYTARTSASRPLILHYNGTTWAPVTIGGPRHSRASQVLNGAAATSASNAWAVGYTCLRHCQSGHEADRTLILHWNGRKWSAVPSPDPGARRDILNAVTATSATNAWAAGGFVTRAGTTATLILRWNGRAWTPSPTPRRSTNASLFAASAIPAARKPAPPAWAVGYTCAAPDCAADFLHPVILRWNGTSWTSS